MPSYLLHAGARGLSVGLLAGCLSTGTINASDQPKREEAGEGLPMAAQLLRSYANVRDQCDPRRGRPDGKLLHVIEGKGTVVGVWEQQGGCFRVTPTSFGTKGWVWAAVIGLNPTVNIPADLPYLQSIKAHLREEREKRLLSGCAVLHTRARSDYEGPGVASSSWGVSWYGGEGEVVSIYRRQGEWMEIGDRNPEGWRTWVTEGEDIAEEICSLPIESCLSLKPRFYRSLTRGAFRVGPTLNLRPVSFFTEGQVVEGNAVACNGWVQVFDPQLKKWLWSVGGALGVISESEFKRVVE